MKVYALSLDPFQERLAQLLTRDAWVYFSNLISSRDLFHVKEIPMMPRRGAFELENDAEIVQYYIDYAAGYRDELLSVYGWSEEQAQEAIDSFISLLESTTGVNRSNGNRQVAS